MLGRFRLNIEHVISKETKSNVNLNRFKKCNFFLILRTLWKNTLKKKQKTCDFLEIFKF